MPLALAPALLGLVKIVTLLHVLEHAILVFWALSHLHESAVLTQDFRVRYHVLVKLLAGFVIIRL